MTMMMNSMGMGSDATEKAKHGGDEHNDDRDGIRS